MSLFLGYIHYMMFDKIKFQENLIEKLTELSKDSSPLKVHLDALGTIPQGDLQEIIDPGNIHGWLQDKVNLSEKRLAFVCQELMRESEELEEKILDIAYKEGQRENFSGTAEEAYTWMTNHFLDGMPCDSSIMPLSMEQDHIIFQVIQDLHQMYWEQEKTSFYWHIRSSYMNGLLEKTNYQWIEKPQKIYEIR